jgi:hypothetical protein
MAVARKACPVVAVTYWCHSHHTHSVVGTTTDALTHDRRSASTSTCPTTNGFRRESQPRRRYRIRLARSPHSQRRNDRYRRPRARPACPLLVYSTARARKQVGFARRVRTGVTVGLPESRSPHQQRCNHHHRSACARPSCPVLVAATSSCTSANDRPSESLPRRHCRLPVPQAPHSQRRYHHHRCARVRPSYLFHLHVHDNKWFSPRKSAPSSLLATCDTNTALATS